MYELVWRKERKTRRVEEVYILFHLVNRAQVNCSSEALYSLKAAILNNMVNK